MKKVRYVVGACGIAPAVGLVVTTPAAAAPAAHQARSSAKTVSLEHTKQRRVNCGRNHTDFASTGTGRNTLWGQISYSGTTCVRGQWAELLHFQTGLTERVRFYSGGGHLDRTTWQAGKDIDNQYTFFSSVPNSEAHMVCEALVANGNHADVKYGPVCETT